MERTHYESIKDGHGGHASWAVWAPPTGKPKSNIGDMSIFDLDRNPSLLNTLKSDVIMVGLNISRPLSEPFRNFHDTNPRANDFKIRHAFTGTRFYGAYMTDIIKDVKIVNSSNLLLHLTQHPSLIQENVEAFLQEIRDLRCRNPIVLAFGSATHELFARHVPSSEYSTLIRLTHYSHRIGKEAYRTEVLAQIETASHLTVASV